MKATSTLLICISFLIFTNLTSNAIEVESYTAKEGYASALNFVQMEMSFVKPELLAIGTVKTEIDVAGTNNKIGMDMTDGKSKGWSYAFIDRQSGDTAIVGVAKFLGIYQSQDITDQFPDFFPNTNSKKLENDWINSDALVDAISANTTYQNYIQSNPTAEPSTVILLNNYDVSFLKKEYPYWTTYFGEPSTFICYTDAVTGETNCDAVSSVKQVESISNSFAPNPANNIINIKIDNNSGKFDTIKIVDIFGNIVYQSNNANNSQIDVTNLSNGSYTIMYEYKNKIEIEKLLIQK